MIDDAELFVQTANALKVRGAYKIYVMATHGLMSSDAPRLIEDSCIDEVRLALDDNQLNVHIGFILHNIKNSTRCTKWNFLCSFSMMEVNILCH